MQGWNDGIEEEGSEEGEGEEGCCWEGCEGLIDLVDLGGFFCWWKLRGDLDKSDEACLLGVGGLIGRGCVPTCMERRYGVDYYCYYADISRQLCLYPVILCSIVGIDDSHTACTDTRYEPYLIRGEGIFRHSFI